MLNKIILCRCIISQYNISNSKDENLSWQNPSDFNFQLIKLPFKHSLSDSGSARSRDFESLKSAVTAPTLQAKGFHRPTSDDWSFPTLPRERGDVCLDRDLS